MKKIETVTRIIFLVLSITVLGIGFIHAEDTAIYSGGVVNVPPNVLMIFDTSGSMAYNIPTGEPYNNAITYNNPTDPKGKNDLLYKDSTGWHNLRKKDRWGNDKGQATLSDLSSTSCSGLISTLTISGVAPSAYIKRNTISPYTFTCISAGSVQPTELCTGDYYNYLKDTTAGAVVKPKVDIAKQAVIDLLDSVTEGSVRFGLMVFRGYGTYNYLSESQQNRGGYIIAPLGSSHETIKNAVGETPQEGIRCWYRYYTDEETPYRKNPYRDSLSDSYPTSSGGTPLAETLAEAGLYFAGGNTWANTSGQTGYPSESNGLGSSGRYTSPIQWRCQKNYIIVVTDGMPTVDDGNGNGANIFTRADYIDSKAIGNYWPSTPRDIDKDNEVNPWAGSCDTCIDNGNIWMDDVSEFLYDVDLINSTSKDQDSGASWNDAAFSPQRIVTYAIGFGSGCNEDFLNHVTNNTHGHGKTFMADEGKALGAALTGIIGEILRNNSNFVAPVVPVSKMNRVYAGNSLYISLFRPEEGPEWKGNLKKLGFSNTGLILDKYGAVADFSSSTKPSTCWSDSSLDGLDVDLGGVGAKLLSLDTRKFYTNLVGISSYLPDATNAFSLDNANISNAALGLGATSTVEDRSNLINFIRAEGVYKPVTGVSKRSWVMGDILHSRPVVMRDGNKNIIFVGANDGFLHCFVDDEGSDYANLSDDTVTEEWCFIPDQILPKLQLLRDSETHPVLVDGSPVLYRTGSNQYLTFGLRRGGNNYFTLKVGAFDASNKYIADGYKTPEYKWNVSDNVLGTPLLGQSWCLPRVSKLKTGSGVTDYEAAIVLAGGYDAANQDLDSPASEDTRGMAIFAVRASDGILLDMLKFTKAKANLSSMTHSIVDLISFDSNGDTFDDKIYAGDMGGQLFALKASKTDGTWSGRKMFQAGGGTASTARMKIFYAPDVATQGYRYSSGSNDMYSVYDHVYIGTGDREHPNETGTDNRFYGIKNKDDTAVITEADTDFIDVTYYSTGYVTPHDVNYVKSNDCDGWFIRLGYELGQHVRPGEKVVSSPIVFDGVVYFTTFVPNSAHGGDLCSTSGLGSGLLYAVKYLTGEAAYNWAGNDGTDEEGNIAPVYDERDRYIHGLDLGSGIPPQPKLTVTSNGPVLIVGPKTILINQMKKVKQFYWIHE